MTTYNTPVPAPGSREIPQISREIYGMPAFATLQARSLSATVDWYVRALGFIELFAIPGPGGVPALVHLRRWHFQDLLVRPAAGDVTTGGTITLTFAAAIDELDALAKRASTHGGGQATIPQDTAWNTRDVVTTDPDGNTVVFTAARAIEATDAEFSAKMARWSREQGLTIPDLT